MILRKVNSIEEFFGCLLTSILVLLMLVCAAGGVLVWRLW